MKKSSLFFAFSFVFEAGFLLAAPIVVLLLGGLWLDRKLGMFPFFTLLGSLFGLVGGLINTYRFVTSLAEKRG